MIVHAANPNHVTRMQWDNAVAIARQACARIFRDGGQPSDALKLFGLRPARGSATPASATWDKAVEQIAESLCSRGDRRAA